MKIMVLGADGMVGRAVVAHFMGRHEVVPVGRAVDLTVPRQLPAGCNWAVVAAGLVGGIEANRTRPTDFLTVNAAIATNVLGALSKTGTKVLYLGSSCVYPRECPQPMRPEHLLTGPFEPTNEGYAIAKLVGMRLCDFHRRQHGDDFVSCIPATVYGPFDRFDDPAAGHVLPALVRRFTLAKEADHAPVSLWGNGTPVREFLHADDVADACEFLLENYSGEGPINVGTGRPTTVRHLAELVAGVVGYRGEIAWETDRPAGMPQKLLDTTPLEALGWRPSVALEDGVARTVRWVAENRWCFDRRRP